MSEQYSLDPRNLDPRLFISRAEGIGVHPKNTRRWFGSVMGEGTLQPSEWLERGIITKKIAEKLYGLPVLQLLESVRSPTDGFEKLLFRTHDGLSIESVVIPLEKEGSCTLCISSQVGCPMGCSFCATARLKERRNLETWEIVDQFLQGRKIASSRGLNVTGAVFMGMGEPFLNYERVIAAAQVLCYPAHKGISGKSITISTVGIIDKIQAYTAANFPFRLSISLGAAYDEKRALLVPIAARTPVNDVMQAARSYALRKNTRINLAYVCVSGVNVSIEDAKELGKLIGDTPVRIDLISVTDPTGRFMPPTEVELSRFRDALRLYVGQPVVRRYSGGADINAACGTLAGQSLVNPTSI
jgi:23S rRNA (adenine2503-C2)-methyltransferase